MAAGPSTSTDPSTSSGPSTSRAPGACTGSATRSYVSDPNMFLEAVCSNLGWKHLEDENIVDVGCGNPTIKMAELLLKRFPRVHKILAIDKKKNLIEYLKCKITEPQIEHHFCDIEERVKIANWKGLVHKVISTHCFHQLKHQTAGFENIHFILMPGGEAAFLFCTWSGFAEWHIDLAHNLKWNSYFNGNSPLLPETQNMNLNETYYRKVLEDAGFIVVVCRLDDIIVPYNSDKECKAGLVKLSESTFVIPNDLKEEFNGELFDTFMKYNIRGFGGRPCTRSKFITAFVRKPL